LNVILMVMEVSGPTGSQVDEEAAMTTVGFNAYLGWTGVGGLMAYQYLVGWRRRGGWGFVIKGGGRLDGKESKRMGRMVDNCWKWKAK
jgi:hypothetical protein